LVEHTDANDCASYFAELIANSVVELDRASEAGHARVHNCVAGRCDGG